VAAEAVCRLLQFLAADGARRVAVSDGAGNTEELSGTTTVYALVSDAIAARLPLVDVVSRRRSGRAVDPVALEADRRLLVPIDHPDPARCWVTGTGLTHLGSASTRDAMHADAAEAEPVSDSMRMFEWGRAGGKPTGDEIGVQPEWFFKGDGSCVVAPGASLPLPAFAEDGGEEAEIVAIYVVGADRTPWRVGFALGNEFSDHVMERRNFLYLAHSKLRSCAFGPELLIGDLPPDIRGSARVRRGSEVVWEAKFASGEANMSHSLRNLEFHHFKYTMFRRQGDLHVHFLGAAALSFTDGVTPAPGDEFEISADGFGLPLRNRLGADHEVPFSGVRKL
jgi:hypothetical protein